MQGLRSIRVWLFSMCCLSALSIPVHADLSGQLVGELRYFPEAASFSSQEELYSSVSAEFEYRTSLFNNPDLNLTFTPFVRYDQHDDERTHVDIRELMVYYASGDWEWRAGIGKVFWGVTESQHLVDVINQTDFIEDLDTEDKLGQPMINITWLQNWGALNFYILPYFRERTFPGVNGRLRPPLVIDTDSPEFLTTTVIGFAPAQYESEIEDGHVDGAIRWSGTVADYWDYGLYYFNGTAREPELLPQLGDNGTVLVPRYNQMHQVGLDLQATLDSWLLKLEVIARSTAAQDHQALVGGFEYTFFDIGAGMDIGALLEYHHDTRGLGTNAIFQNDLFAGIRLGLNDEQSTEFLAGGYLDLDNDSVFFRLEGSRRFGSSFKASLNAQLFNISEPTDPQYFIRQDDYLEFSLGYYF